MNHGVIIEPIKDSDFIAGTVSGLPYVENVPDGNWVEFLPSEERQKKRNVETFACVSYSALNALEVQMNRMLRLNLLSADTVAFLNESGYIEGGLVNCSDRYLAKRSETTPKGNSMQKVCDTLRHGGVLPERDWQFNEEFVWSEYYAEIPQSLIDKAMKFYDYFDIQYEWIVTGLSPSVKTLQKHLKQAPIQIASAVCNGFFTDVPVKTCDLPVAHATMIYKVDRYKEIFDSYAPFKKYLALNYYIPHTMKIIISPKQINNKKMEYVKSIMSEEYLLDKDLMIKLNIGDVPERMFLQARGLTGSPRVMSDIELAKYEDYPLIRKSSVKTSIAKLRDQLGL